MDSTALSFIFFMTFVTGIATGLIIGFFIWGRKYRSNKNNPTNPEYQKSHQGSPLDSIIEKQATPERTKGRNIVEKQAPADKIGQNRSSKTQEKLSRRATELIQNLRVKCFHDDAVVQRLIEIERRKAPHASIEELAERAIDSWERDNR